MSPYETWMLEMRLEGTDLTASERAVLREVALGLTLTEVAIKRGVSRETVKGQARNARARLRAKTLAHAVAIAVSLDLI